MNIKVTAFTETKKLHYTQISAHVLLCSLFLPKKDIDYSLVHEKWQYFTVSLDKFIIQNRSWKVTVNCR